MFRLTLAGPDTLVVSSLCGACPYGPRGCCVAPPRYAWSDVARVVLHGGRDFLLHAIARGDLAPFEHGLRVARRGGAEGRCTFHDDGAGCTIATDRRPATCNYYVCEPALDDGATTGHAAEVARARSGTDRLVAELVAWDEALFVWTAERGRAWDAPFLDALGAAFEALQGGAAPAKPAD